jgi:formyl-CoA transferase
MKINRIVYASGTGYGRRGPIAAARGFDMPSSWTRSGSAFVQTPAHGGPPPNQPGSVGDLTGGATLAGAICAALFRRERTGKGAIVDHALYQMGTYIMSQALIQASMGWKAAGPMPPAAMRPDDELVPTSDNRWLLCLLYGTWWELRHQVGHQVARSSSTLPPRLRR